MTIALLLLAPLALTLAQDPAPLETPENRIGGGWFRRHSVYDGAELKRIGYHLALGAGPKPEMMPFVLVGAPGADPASSAGYPFQTEVTYGGWGRLGLLRLDLGEPEFVKAGGSDGHFGYSPGIIRKQGSYLARNFALGIGTNVFSLTVSHFPFGDETVYLRGISGLQVFDREGNPVWWRSFPNELPEAIAEAVQYFWTGRARCAANVGELNGDRWDDIAIGIPGYPPTSQASGRPLRSHIQVLSGSDGAILAEMTGPNWSFGKAVHALGDLDLDGRVEFAVAECSSFVGPLPGPDDPMVTGALHILSLPGDPGSDLQDQELAAPGGAASAFGTAVVGGLSLDGDLKPDFVVSAPRETVGADEVGAVRAYSGADVSLIWEHFGTVDGTRLGRRLASVGDLNGDGVAEIVASESSYYGSGTGGFQILSGADGALLMRCKEDGATGFGASLISLGDYDADGMPNLAIGSPWSGYGWLFYGKIEEYELEPYLSLSASDLSVGGGGSITADLDFSPAEGDRKYYAFLSASGTGPHMLANGVWLPLTQDALLDSFVDNAPPAWVDNVISQRTGLLDGEGKASFTLTAIPGLSGFVGGSLYLAVVTLNPAPDNSPRLSSMVRRIEIVP